MKKKVLTIAMACLVAASAAGCAGARKTPDPVGVGTGTHELKESPCACAEVPMALPGSIAS